MHRLASRFHPPRAHVFVEPGPPMRQGPAAQGSLPTCAVSGVPQRNLIFDCSHLKTICPNTSAAKLWQGPVPV